MIGKLRGRVDETDEDSVILDVGGVGYHVFCAGRTLAALPAKGEFAELIIESHVREDHFHLYGFPSAEERHWFRLLTTVQGVGVKMAMAILSAYTPGQLAQAIAAGDAAAMKRISGVGPTLAQRLVTELKNKVAKMATSTVIPMTKKGKGAPAHTPSEEAMSALVNLGYTRSDAFGAIARAQQKQGEKAGLDELIKEGLKELAR